MVIWNFQGKDIIFLGSLYEQDTRVYENRLFVFIFGDGKEGLLEENESD